MTQENTESGIPEPGPDTFDFEAWLEDKATFPEFKHTAYVDQGSGVELAKVLDEFEILLQQREALGKRISAHAQQSSNSFVGDATLDAMREEMDALDGHLEKLKVRRSELNAKIQETAITLTFEVRTPEMLGNVTREAVRQFHKDNPQYKSMGEDDLDYLTARTRYQLTYQIAHFCVGVEFADGRKLKTLTQQQADKLLSRLISSEMMRLMESVGQGLSGAQEWANKLDAGFPGGSPDMEEVSLDSYSPEGGEVMGSPSYDHADRQAVGLD